MAHWLHKCMREGYNIEQTTGKKDKSTGGGRGLANIDDVLNALPKSVRHIG